MKKIENIENELIKLGFKKHYNQYLFKKGHITISYNKSQINNPKNWIVNLEENINIHWLYRHYIYPDSIEDIKVLIKLFGK